MSLPIQPDTLANPNAGPAMPPPPAKAQQHKVGFFGRFRAYLWLGAICIIIAAGIAVFVVLRLASREPFTGPTATVVRQKLLVTIVERGSLESAENNDIVVRIKAGTKGSTNASIIKWVVDDGKEV